MNAPAGRADDTVVNASLFGIGGLFLLGAALRGAGSIAALLGGTAQPRHGIAAGLGAVLDPRDPASALSAPGLSPILYWAVVAVLFLGAVALTVVCSRAVRRHKHHKARDPHRIDGVATADDIAPSASKKALLARARVLRPSLTHPQAADVGYLLGHSCGQEIWASVEDSILVVGPPRSGKGMHLVINAILDAPGAVITTSTRNENVRDTIEARRMKGPVAVFDPQRLATSLNLPGGLRWSPVRGCADPLTAMIRASGLAATTGLSSGGVESGGFWEGKARTALQCLLHAAALDERPTRTLYEWSLSPAAAADAAGILHSEPRAAIGWANALESMINSDPRTRDSIWMAVSEALAALADPRVLDAVSPAPGEEFDPAEFLRENGTLYLLATSAGAGTAWALVAAFIEDLTETARHLAAASPGSRLDPPLLLALDEIGNLAPLPSLPVLMAEGGGTGITTMPILQSLSQARQKWGEHAASAIWDASIVKVFMGGSSATKDLSDISTLIGEHDEFVDSSTRNSDGSISHQRSTRRAPVMPAEAARMLPRGTALILLRSAPPIIADLSAWADRRPQRFPR